ncbi:MAG: filamentous hemagglutinin N-terminal domain-containing protein [Pseudomonadota bacterium]
MKNHEPQPRPPQRTGRPAPGMNLRRKCLAVLIAACYGAAQANPVAPQVVAGQAQFSQQGNLYSITNTPNTIINWQSFSINQNEITRFIQQSADSKVLNRIQGQDPSRILGALQSNGKVFLINPNGILFGKDARIDVNGLVASSLALTNADFLAGRQNYAGGAQAGKVVNQGSIVTPQGGQVFLLASSVENSGVITSPQGDIILAAGNSVQLADSANPDVHVVVSAPADQALNLGRIVAQSGRVGIYGALVNQRGSVNADSAVRGPGGKIVLKASGSTLLEAGSVTSAASSAGQGGDIKILGPSVALDGNARVDASGAAGGGTVLIGGDYQGKNSALPNAQQVSVGKDASIAADATEQGDGGKIIVWGDQAAQVHGALSARGGAHGGDGGLVETSGHYLDVADVRVDTRAAHGQTGQWLLDPYNIDINTVASDSEGVTQIAPSVISNATSNVSLQATHDITFSSPVSIAAAGIGLSAQAGHDIRVQASLGSNAGAITLQANQGDSANGTGTLSVTAPLSTGGGNLALGGAAVTIGAAVSLGLGNVTLSANKAGGGIVVNSSGSITGTSDSSASPLFSFVADQVALNGAVNGGGPTEGTTVSFVPYTAERGILLATAKDSEKLGLAPADLARISASGVNIGSSGSSGGIIVAENVTLSQVRNLFFESAGDIAINAGVHVSQSSGTLYAGTYGTSSQISFGSNGVFDAYRVLLRSDNMALGSTAGTVLAPGGVKLDAYSGDAAIKLGAGASGASGTLVLTDDELLAITTPQLQIGTAADYAGALSVSGALNLKNRNSISSATATDALQLGGASIDIGGALSVPAMLKLQTDGSITGTGSVAAPALYMLAGVRVGLPTSPLNTTASYLNVSTPGSVTLNESGSITSGSVSAATLTITAGGSIGTGNTEATALVTNVAQLSAASTAGSGSYPINIVNNKDAPSSLEVSKLYLASGNTGAITLNNYGAVEVSAAGMGVSAPGTVTLAAHSPLTINGAVSGGGIVLSASTGISLGSTSSLQSASNINMSAGTGIQLGGTLTAPTGISAVAQTGSITTVGTPSINSNGPITLNAVTGTVSTGSASFPGTAPQVVNGATNAAADAAAAAAAAAAAKAAADAAAKAAADAAAKAAADAAAKAAADAAAKAAADAAAKAAADAATKAAADAAAKAAADAAADAAAKAAADAAAKAAADAAAKAASDAAAKAAADAAAKAAADAAADAAAKAAADAAAKASADAAAKAAADAAAKAAADASAKAAADAAAKAAADAAAKAAADATAKAAADAAAKAAADATAKAAADAAAKAAADAAAKAAADATAKAAADAAAKAAADAAAQDAAVKAAADAAAKAAIDKALADAAIKAAADKAIADKAAADKAAAEASQTNSTEPVGQAINSTVNIINASIKAKVENDVTEPKMLAKVVASAPAAPAQEEQKGGESKKEEKKDGIAAKDIGVKKDEPVKKLYCN